jgi:hypothetical protein
MSTVVSDHPVLQHRSLLDDTLWQRLVARVRKDGTFVERFGAQDDATQQAWAERIMDGAVGFLVLCAAGHGEGYSPSPLVDIGWHTFLLYTAEYAEFCHRVAGRFIHHAPHDVPGVAYHPGGVDKTLAALMARGLPVDTELWAGDGVCDPECSGCCDYCDPNKKKK